MKKLLLPCLLAAGACRPAPGPAPDQVRIAVPYEVRTLDPHAKNSLTNFSLVSNLYEPLVTTDAEMKIRPCLARLWENPDPLTWVFHLRDGVRFHSGRPLGARDVAATFRRLMSRRDLEIRGYALYIDSVEATDRLTLRLRTKRPLSILLNKLRFILVVPEGVTDEDLAARPDGSGPYRLLEWRPNEAVRFERYPGYWGPAPALRVAEFLLDRSPDQAAQDVLTGRCRIAQCNSRRAEQAIQADGRFTLERRPSLFVKYLGYDLVRDDTPFAAAKPNPFKRKAVRQALHVGIDRRRLVAALPSSALPATQLVPPSIFGFNPNLAPPAYDPERARHLLREAGLPHGFSATLHVRKILAPAAFEVRDQLRELGVNVDVAIMGDPEFLAAVRRHETSFHLSRFGAPTGDISDILETGLHTPDPERFMGIGNYGGYSNPEVDRAIEESAGIERLQARRQALERVVARIMDDLAWVPLYVDEDVYAVDRALAWEPRYDSFILAAEVAQARP